MAFIKPEQITTKPYISWSEAEDGTVVVKNHVSQNAAERAYRGLKGRGLKAWGWAKPSPWERLNGFLA